MEIVSSIVLVVGLSFIIEYLTNILKELVTLKTEYPYPLLISLTLGVTLGLLLQVDFFTALGFQPVNQLVAYIATGLIAAGGSKGVHELIAKLRASRQDICD